MTARELEKPYEQLMELYASAFVDTATGANLDCVAGIADVERVNDVDLTVQAATGPDNS